MLQEILVADAPEYFGYSIFMTSIALLEIAH